MAHRHNWQRPLELVGGLRENPGVGSYGQVFKYHSVCAICGAHKYESRDIVTNRETKRIDPPTPESRKWARSQQAE